MAMAATETDEALRPPATEPYAKQSIEGKRFNEAIWRLRTDRCRNIAEIDEQLSAITGLTATAIRRRSERIEYGDRPEPASPPILDDDTRSHLELHYGETDDPAVLAWMAEMGVQQRPHPDGATRRRYRPKQSAR